MKTKLFFIVFLLFISFGCNEEKHGIELIQSENVYLPLSELDKYPELQSENMGNDTEDNINIHLQKVFQQLSDHDKQNFSAKYLFLINENGTVDKIQIISSTSKKIDELFAKTVKDWKFNPAIKNGKNVKSISPWSFNPQFSSGEIISEGGDDIYFVSVENMPEPIGGIKSIQEKILYPEIAKRAGIEGRVFIQAFIDETGNVVEAKVIKGAGYGLDEAALDAVKKTKFSPGKQKGEPVKVQVSIPIVFKLDSQITILKILSYLNWGSNPSQVKNILTKEFPFNSYEELILVDEATNKSKIYEYSGGSLYALPTSKWSFVFYDNQLDFIAIRIKTSDYKNKTSTFEILKREIEKIAREKNSYRLAEWVLSDAKRTVVRLQVLPKDNPYDILMILSSGKLIDNNMFK